MITAQKVAIIDYKLSTTFDSIIASGESHPYIQGLGSLLPGMEKALLNKSVGEKIDIEIPANEAFGDRHDFEPVVFTQDQLGAQFDRLAIGMALPFAQADGSKVTLFVADLTDTIAAFTVNHPLAGHNLKFTAEVKDIRDATPAELQSGFPHGADGTEVPAEQGSSCACC